MDNFYKELCRFLTEDSIKTKEPMKNHTTFRIGGPADYYLLPSTIEELIKAAGCCRKNHVTWCVVGGGSNLLVSDTGYEGVILSTEKLDECQINAEEIRAMAGIRLSRLAKTAAEASLTGFEFAAGIPGTLGGAIVMNAGAYGSEIKDVLAWAKVLDEKGQVRIWKTEELELGYRVSRIQKKGGLILEAGLRLSKGLRSEIYGKMEELARLRQEKQPLEYPSAGSTFKRPQGYFAGKLIEDAGLRGYRQGGAQVSEKHCGFVINRDKATAEDVMAVCQEIKRRVREMSGIELELEIRQL